jgi:anti-anti-sigma regulatory factor
MTNPAASLSVWATEQSAWIRVAGRANLQTSRAFELCVERFVGQGHALIRVDLSDCLHMDSTFIGQMLKREKARRRSETPRPPEIVFCNPPKRIVDLLDSLMLTGVLPIQSDVERPPLAEFQTVEGADVTSPQQLARASLQAHQELSQHHPTNEAKFRDVVQLLTEELERQAPPPPKGNTPTPSAS